MAEARPLGSSAALRARASAAACRPSGSEVRGRMVTRSGRSGCLAGMPYRLCYLAIRCEFAVWKKEMRTLSWGPIQHTARTCPFARKRAARAAW